MFIGQRYELICTGVEAGLLGYHRIVSPSSGFIEDHTDRSILVRMEIYCLLALIIIRYILGENRGNVLGSQLPIRRDDRLPFAIHQLSFSIYEKTIFHEVVGPGRITVKVLGTEPENCYSRRHSRLGGSILFKRNFFLPQSFTLGF